MIRWAESACCLLWSEGCLSFQGEWLGATCVEWVRFHLPVVLDGYLWSRCVFHVFKQIMPSDDADELAVTHHR